MKKVEPGTPTPPHSKDASSQPVPLPAETLPKRNLSKIISKLSRKAAEEKQKHEEDGEFTVEDVVHLPIKKNLTKTYSFPPIPSQLDSWSPSQMEAEALWAFTLIASGVSLQICDHYPVVNYMKNLLPKYQYRTSEHYMNVSLEVIFYNMKKMVNEIVQNSLKSDEPVTINVGCFHGQRGIFLQVSLQYVDDEFQYRHVILGMKQIALVENSSSLLQHFHGILDEYQSLAKKKIRLVYDPCDYLLHKTLAFTKYEICGTSSCILKKLDRTIRLGMEESTTGEDFLAKTYQIFFWLRSDVNFKNELQQLCRDLKGKLMT